MYYRVLGFEPTKTIIHHVDIFRYMSMGFDTDSMLVWAVNIIRVLLYFKVYNLEVA